MKVATKKRSLAGRVEARAILSVSKQRLHVIEDHEDFPAPVDVLDDGQGRHMPIWERAKLVSYAENRMAPGRQAVAADD